MEGGLDDRLTEKAEWLTRHGTTRYLLLMSGGGVGVQVFTTELINLVASEFPPSASLLQAPPCLKSSLDKEDVRQL